MARRYVSSPRTGAPILPVEVTRLAPRAYVDRFGVEFDVVWNGQKDDPTLIGSYDTAPPQYLEASS